MTEKFEEFIKANKRDLDLQSNLWIASALDDLRHLSANPVTCIRILIRSLYNKYQTKKYFDRLPKDPKCWIYIHVEKSDWNYERYRQWAEKNHIQYDVIYGSVIGGIDAAYAFRSKEDAMAFRLTWL